MNDNYLEKRLKQFDEVFADYFVIKTGLMADHKSSIKSFIAISIQQAVAEERARLKEEVDKPTVDNLLPFQPQRCIVKGYEQI